MVMDSRKWLGRGTQLKQSLQELRELGEPAAIPEIVDFLVDRDTDVAREACATLHALAKLLPPSVYLALDDRVRRGGSWRPVDAYWRRLSPAMLARIHADWDVPLLLGIASCHGNGYVRECAVELLGSLAEADSAIPFLLLRLDDWVDPVRRGAEECVARLLTPANRAAFLRFLPLIARLGDRSRASNSLTSARIQSFLQGNIAALTEAAMVSPDSRGRNYGLSLAWKGATDRGEEMQRAMIGRMVQSPNPAVRHGAAMWLAKMPSPALLPEEFLPALLQDRVPNVRYVALGWCATRKSGEYERSLQEALLDQSAALRALAQFHLTQKTPIDLRHYYRAAVIAAQPTTLRAALGGLGETGKAEDENVILPFTEERKISVRKAALAALAKLALQQHLNLFVTALQDKSSGVSRQARVALEPCVCDVGAERLEEILVSAPFPHVRTQVLSLINRLSKWAKLSLLIRAVAEYKDVPQIIAAGYLRSWMFSYNRTHFVLPTTAELDRLRAVLSLHGPRLEASILRELQALANASPSRI